MVDALSDGAPEQSPRLDLADTESCGGGIRFLAPYLIVWGQARPPTSWPPVNWLDVGSRSPELNSVRKSRSRRFQSIWTPFDIPFLRNTETGNQTAIWAGPPVG